VFGGHPYPAGTVALISGQCVGGGFGTDVVSVVGSAPGAGRLYDYSYTALESGGVGLSCAAGYATGYWFGKADIADFFIDRTDPTHPALKLRLDPNSARSTAMTVAFDIDDLQVRYHLDTGNPGTKPLTTDPDRIADTVCDDLSAASCAAGLGFSARQKAARIIGVELAVVARTRRYRVEWRQPTLVNMTVHNHTMVGRNDGYRRWTYRTTIMTRNNKIW
jgi:hypothetical protein